MSPGQVAQMVNDITQPIKSISHGAASTTKHLAMSHCPSGVGIPQMEGNASDSSILAFGGKKKTFLWGAVSDGIKARALLSYTGESTLTYRFRNPRRPYNEKNREGP